MCLEKEKGVGGLNVEEVKSEKVRELNTSIATALLIVFCQTLEEIKNITTQDQEQFLNLSVTQFYWFIFLFFFTFYSVLTIL